MTSPGGRPRWPPPAPATSDNRLVKRRGGAGGQRVWPLLRRRHQPGGLLVEVAYLGGAGAEGLGQERADGPELGQRLVGVALGGQQLRDDKAGLEDLARFVPACGRIGVLHVEPEL